jgi:peptidoglycan LD-endopeptidase LytH
VKPTTKRRKLKFFLGFVALVFAVGLLLPQNPVIPVQGATPRDWNPLSFWFEPWGASGVHKGIDIFAPKGRPVVAAVPGIRVFQGHVAMGGNVVAVLGPKWRIHYYAHLQDGANDVPLFVGKGSAIGAVGTSGNAQGKPAHLHYSVISLIPLPWHVTTHTQGWKRMFYVHPGEMLLGG